MQPHDNQANFYQAMIAGDVAQIIHFLKYGAVDINHRDVTHDLETPLMSLCHVQFQTPDAIHQVLAAVQTEELKINQKDALGRTLAMHACIAGNIAMMEFTIAHGCDVMVTDRKGKNLVHHVAMTGNEVLVTLVLKHPDVGLAVRILDFQGYSPVDVARQKRHSAIARQLSSALQQGSRSDDRHGTPRPGQQDITGMSHGDTQQAASSQISLVSTSQSAPSNPSVISEAYHQKSNRVSQGYLWKNNPREYEPRGDNSGTVNGSPIDRSSQPSFSPRSENADATADNHQQIPLTRKASLRRSHIFRKPAECDQSENVPATLRSQTPLPPCYNPRLSPPAAQTRISSQANRESSQAVSRPSHPDGPGNRTQLVSNVSRSNPSTPKRVLFNNAVLRQTSSDSGGRLSASLGAPFVTPSGRVERPRSVLALQGFPSPRPVPKQVHSRHRVLVVRPQDSEDEARIKPQWPRDKEDDGFGEGAAHEQCLGAPSNTSEQLTELHIRSTKNRLRERRSSISLPDLRDMAGCLVTSNKPDTFSHLAVGAESRVTIENLERGRSTNYAKVLGRDEDNNETNRLDENSDSDVSLDSNFEDESPIKPSQIH